MLGGALEARRGRGEHTAEGARRLSGNGWRRSAGFRLGPIKASPGVPLNPQGSGERCTFGSVRHKKGDILLECVIWGSGKLQCEAFIGPRRFQKKSCLVEWRGCFLIG